MVGELFLQPCCFRCVAFAFRYEELFLQFLDPAAVGSLCPACMVFCFEAGEEFIAAIQQYEKDVTSKR